MERIGLTMSIKVNVTEFIRNAKDNLELSGTITVDKEKQANTILISIANSLLAIAVQSINIEEVLDKPVEKKKKKD